jgi:hypothetical protein
MKIVSNKKGWQFQAKDSSLYVDPEETVRETEGKQIFAFTNVDSGMNDKYPGKFIIDSEGRFQLSDFFVEGLYINPKKERLSYYITVDNIRFLYVGTDIDGRGEDSQHNLGNIDVLVIRPEDQSDLNLITTLTSEYEPLKMLVLLDRISEDKLEKVCKYFGKTVGEIEASASLKAKDMVREEEEKVEAMLIR